MIDIRSLLEHYPIMLIVLGVISVICIVSCIIEKKKITLN